MQRGQKKQKSSSRFVGKLVSINEVLRKGQSKLLKNANLCENIFILHNQRVGVYVPGKEVLFVALCAPLGSALHVLSTWRGNQSEVNYNYLPSNSACMHWSNYRTSVV